MIPSFEVTAVGHFVRFFSVLYYWALPSKYVCFGVIWKVFCLFVCVVLCMCLGFFMVQIVFRGGDVFFLLNIY